jgi:hypothetical protein
MLKKYFVLTFLICLLFGCSTISQPLKCVKSPTASKSEKTKKYTSTNPKLIKFTVNNKVNHQYQKIATISVNHYNLVGVKRQAGVINDLIRTYAAELGGNAVINIHTERNAEIGEVIRFT